eukprot:26899_1
MSAFVLLLVFIITTISSKCIDEYRVDPERGVHAINSYFDLASNDELQTLQDEVIRNACNFGDPSLSSSLFSFAPGYTNLHCGSYGAQPKYVVQYHDHIRNFLYSKPHSWNDVYSVAIMNLLRQQIATYLGIHDMSELVFTINASHGMNAVIRSLMDHFLSQHLTNISDYSVVYFNT